MTLKEQVSEALYDVDDPELGINIMDLGLVYGVDVDEKNNVVVTMTLTTPGCPMHDSISTGVENRVKSINEVENVEVNIVWEPQWDPSKMSDSAKELLW
jgi:metal-sulfur cluster biosynthetic enzyme